MIGITYVSEAPIPSKAANCVQMLHVVSSLTRAGCDVKLYAPRTSQRFRGEAGARQMREDFAIEPVDIRYLPYVEIKGRLGGSFFPVAAGAARLSGRRYLMTRSNRIAKLATDLGLKVILETHNPPNSDRNRAALEAAVRSKNLVSWVFISDRLRAIHGPYVRSHTPAIVLHDAVDIERFTPALTVREARQKLGLEARGKVVLHAGSLYTGRGAEELIQSLPFLPSDTELWFVGGRPADVSRVEQGVPSALRERVRFFGHKRVSELPLYLFAADVLVLASRSWGTAIDGSNHVDHSSPMKLFEYLAAGRPIVAAGQAGVREVITPGQHALLFEVNDTNAMRDALSRVCADDVLSAELGANARRKAQEHTWAKRAKALLERLT